MIREGFAFDDDISWRLILNKHSKSYRFDLHQLAGNLAGIPEKNREKLSRFLLFGRKLPILLLRLHASS